MKQWNVMILTAAGALLTAASLQAQPLAPALPAPPDAAASQAAAASAPRTTLDGKAVPRPLTPAELRESGKPLDETMPEGKAVPQLSIPIGPRPPEAASGAKPARVGAAGGVGGVAEGAARCQAQESDALRARCRADLARARNAKPR